MVTIHRPRLPARHPARGRLGRAAAAIAVAVGSLVTVGALALMVLFGPTGTLDPGPLPPISTPTAALVIDPGSVTDAGATANLLGAATVRVSASSDGTPVFVGIGRATDVDRYLSGVATDVVAVGADGSVPTGLDRQPGQVRAVPPTEQPFWVTSATSATLASREAPHDPRGVEGCSASPRDAGRPGRRHPAQPIIARPLGAAPVVTVATGLQLATRQ